MKPTEAKACIDLLRALWPQVSSWEDNRIDEMQRAFRMLNYPTMTMTLRAMNDDVQWEFPPRWANIFDEYNRTERNLKRTQREAAGELTGGMAPHADPADYPVVDHRTLKPSGILTRVVMGRMQKEIASMTVPLMMHDHKSGAWTNCPVCSLHDHDDEGRHVAECRRCENLDIVAYDLVRTRYYNNPRWITEHGVTLADEWRAMEARGEEIPVVHLPERALW